MISLPEMLTAKLNQEGIFSVAPTHCVTTRTAFYDAELSDSDNVETWEENGGQDMRKRAFDKWNRMLANYETPPIDPATREALDDYVARRKEEIPDAWY